MRTITALCVLTVPLLLASGCGGRLRMAARPALPDHAELVRPEVFNPRLRHGCVIRTGSPALYYFRADKRLDVNSDAEVFSAVSGSVLHDDEGFAFEAPD